MNRNTGRIHEESAGRAGTAGAALLLAALLAVCLAHVADCQERVILGYQKHRIPSNSWNMISLDLESFDGGAIPIQDLFYDPLGSGLQGGTFNNTAFTEAIMVWDPDTSGYTSYWLYNSGGAYPSWDGKWIDPAGTLSEDAFAVGTTFWLVTPGTGATLRTAGRISLEETAEVLIHAATHTMFGSPYMAPVSFNDGGLDWFDLGASGATGAFDSDQIQLFDPVTSGYTTYWLYDSGGAYPSWDEKWIDMESATSTTNSLPAGQAAWYLSAGTNDWVLPIARPY
jgi:hypothetical protein